jgi:hypothetical protein
MYTMYYCYVYIYYSRSYLFSGSPGGGPSRQAGLQGRTGGCTACSEVHDGGDRPSWEWCHFMAKFRRYDMYILYMIYFIYIYILYYIYYIIYIILYIYYILYILYLLYILYIKIYIHIHFHFEVSFLVLVRQLIEGTFCRKPWVTPTRNFPFNIPETLPIWSMSTSNCSERNKT